MDKVEKMFIALSVHQSDINEHMETLKKYAEDCESVTEMGVRWVVSTYAFAVAKPKKLTSIDLYNPSHWGEQFKIRLDDIEDYCVKNNISFSFKEKNTLEIEIEPTDLLFIDTLHAYGQLKNELKLHGNKVKKYIIFHDTTSYENHDEAAGAGEPKIVDIKNTLDNSKHGIWPAIEEFLNDNADWKIHERFTNNNGLTVLKRI